MQRSKSRRPDRQQVKGQTLVKRDNLKDLTTEMFKSMKSVHPDSPVNLMCSFLDCWLEISHTDTGRALGGHWEKKTPLRGAALSTEVIALALLYLCCQRVMSTSIKHDFMRSKPTATGDADQNDLFSTRL